MKILPDFLMSIIILAIIKNRLYLIKMGVENELKYSKS